MLDRRCWGFWALRGFIFVFSFIPPACYDCVPQQVTNYDTGGSGAFCGFLGGSDAHFRFFSDFMRADEIISCRQVGGPGGHYETTDIGADWVVHVESFFHMFGRAFNCLRDAPETRYALYKYSSYLLYHRSWGIFAFCGKIEDGGVLEARAGASGEAPEPRPPPGAQGT